MSPPVTMTSAETATQSESEAAESGESTEAPTQEPEPRIEEIDRMVATARTAAVAFRKLDQEAVDRIVWAMVVAGLEAAVDLAQAASEETVMGVFEDKVLKNYIATEFLYDYLKDKKTVGVIDRDEERNIEYVAEPVGLVLAVTPVTNPTSTVLFKAIVAAKTRNAVIVKPSPHATRCAAAAVKVMVEAAEAAGMPPGALQVIDADRDETAYLFNHPGVDLIWATGGPGVVDAANRTGKPVISVGPGNAPVYIHRSADIPMVVVDLLISKTFDASVICPAEQTMVVDSAIYDDFLAEVQRMGARLLNTDEVDRLAAATFDADQIKFAAVGQVCTNLASMAGFNADPRDKILLAPLPADLEELARHPFVHEKLMPVLGVVRSESLEHALDACDLVTQSGGLGHTSAVYANDEAVIEAFAQRIRTGRILVNAPTAVGALGGVYNSMTPTFSLGCGTWGASSTTDNVNYKNLLNIKTVSRRLTPPQWFRLPSEVYFNVGALENLRTISAETALIVTDSDTERRGAADEVRHHLEAGTVHVFSNVDPEPTEAQIAAGVDTLKRLKPNLIVAVGGGSVIDAAKTLRLLYENPAVSIRELSLPFLDARKRVAVYPGAAHEVRLVACPTTSGTGSEVSPAAVVTHNGRKVTLVDYSLVPDMAVVEPRLTMTMPPSLTADTGIDALTHALEAAISIFASPYTDAFCVQAMNLIFEHLPRAYHNGNDIVARTAMANAATIAGLAFSNAFVGLNHAMAHAVGAIFKVPHGRANGILLPHVLRFNAGLPTKFMPAPGYTSYVAPAKLAQGAWVLGLGGHGEEEARQHLFEAVDKLLDEVAIPRSFADAGIGSDEFEAALPNLARFSFEDPSIRTNPRFPLVTEIVTLFRAAYEGRP